MNPRDVSGGARRRDAVQRFADACAGDTDVVAAFLGGSLAAGTADDFSDLDLYAITTDTRIPRVRIGILLAAILTR